MEIPQKLGIKLLHDLIIPLLGMHPGETRADKDTHTPVLTAALLTIARTQKQPRDLSVDGLTRKSWYIYTVEYYLATKRNTFESVLMRWMTLEPVTVKSKRARRISH